MAKSAEYPHVQRVESNFPANRAKTGKFNWKFESSASSASRRVWKARAIYPRQDLINHGSGAPPGIQESDVLLEGMGIDSVAKMYV